MSMKKKLLQTALLGAVLATQTDTVYDVNNKKPIKQKTILTKKQQKARNKNKKAKQSRKNNR
jgi:hypothetical protein